MSKLNKNPFKETSYVKTPVLLARRIGNTRAALCWLLYKSYKSNNTITLKNHTWTNVSPTELHIKLCTTIRNVFYALDWLRKRKYIYKLSHQHEPYYSLNIKKINQSEDVAKQQKKV